MGSKRQVGGLEEDISEEGYERLIRVGLFRQLSGLIVSEAKYDIFELELSEVRFWQTLFLQITMHFCLLFWDVCMHY